MSAASDPLQIGSVSSDRFTVLRQTQRVWVVAAIHGEAERLAILHDIMAPEIQPGDRIVYTGNYFGYGVDGPGVLEELLRFRTWFLSHPPYRHIDDLVFLRGAQEEMWWKLMQLQFAPDPAEILEWMCARGMDGMLTALGFTMQDGLARAQEGTLALTYWTNKLRETARSLPGHDALFSALKRAAYTDTGSLLIVHTGLDPDKPLARQSDALWWAARSFDSLNEPYRGFQKIVRGFDPNSRGLLEGNHTLSIDEGAGRGGPMNAVLLDPDGDLITVATA